MNDNKKDPKGSPGFRMPGGLMMVLIAVAIVMLFQMLFIDINTNQVNYSDFITWVKEDKVASVEFQADRLRIQLKDDVVLNPDGLTGSERLAAAGQQVAQTVPAETVAPIATPETLADDSMLGSTFNSMQEQQRKAELICITGRIDDPELLALMEQHGVTYTATLQNNSLIQFLFVQILMPILLLCGMWMLLRRTMNGVMGGGKGGFMSIGQSNAKMYMEKKTGVTFDDVAGQEEAKESLTEIVDFLHNPDKYAAIGAKQPKGALLVGPPGTGKTLLAKAVAGEANVVFFSLSGSDFVEMFVGVGASRVRDLFKQASQQAPCIIFIDEIDAIGKSRDNAISSNDEREQTLNQLLAEMDGFDSSKGVVILGATNRPEILDKALLRPGRFDRRIIVERPDLKGREDVLKVHSKKVKMDPSVDLHRIALATPGAAGADLANMINEGALRAVRMNRSEVRQDDLMEAVEIVIAGKEKKDRIMTEKEKRIVAFHEVGHALANALQKDAMPVQKITIVPRTMGSLGYTLNMPEEEKFMQSKDEMLAAIVSFMAGRAAERLVFDIETTGASNDIEKATKMARSMVSIYGMSEKFGLMNLESVESKYLDGRAVLNCSDETGAEIDREVNRILQECYQKAGKLLKENEAKLKEIAEFLFAKETILGEEFMEILKQPAKESWEL